MTNNNTKLRQELVNEGERGQSRNGTRSFWICKSPVNRL